MGELRDRLNANKAEENQRKEMLNARARQSHEYALELVGVLREERVSLCGLYQITTRSTPLPGMQNSGFRRGMSTGGPTRKVSYSAHRLGSGWPLEQCTADVDTSLFVLEDGRTYKTDPYTKYGDLIDERPYRTTSAAGPDDFPFYFYGELAEERITTIVAELISNKGANF